MGHCQIQLKEAFCDRVTGNMWRTGRLLHKGDVRGGEGRCQAEDAFKVSNDPNDMSTNYSEEMPARAPDWYNINKCELDGKREDRVAVE